MIFGYHPRLTRVCVVPCFCGNSRSSDSTPTSTSSGDPLSPGAQALNEEPAPEFRYRWEDLKIGRPLGGGAQASVKKCKHIPTGMNFALKSIPLDNEVTHPKAVVAEVSTLYESSCPFIISFKEAFYKDNCIQLLLELMDYGSLQDLIDKYVGKKGKKLPEELLCDITTKVVKGLVYIHDVHVVHRDIKPANILLNSKGEVKLTDFGMAGKAANTIAQLETFQGTVTYMSPERILGKAYSFESDIWALGLSMAQCALGTFPYKCIPKDQNDKTGFFELLEEITSQERLTLSETDTSPEFREFVWACMEKDPAQRPTAKQLLDCAFLKKYEGKEFDLGKWLQKHLPRKRKEKKPNPLSK